MIACKRCGLCCCSIRNNKFHRCKHLVILKNGKTLCRVYKTRIGRNIGGKHVCIVREDTEFDYVGCPFNTDKPFSLIVSLKFPYGVKKIG